MDGIHDLGGRKGFGAVDVHETEEPFHEAWEARVYGIVRALSRPRGWTIDRFRFTRERIPPVEYLTRPYYDQWLQAYAAMLIDSGIATVSEVASGRSTSGKADVAPPMRSKDVSAHASKLVPFDRDYAGRPRFGVGDSVRARPLGSPGHTRLPGYVRGRRGAITHYRGAHVFPDESAAGVERAEPLYTVAFTAAELWPDAENGADLIHVDLWESYLEPV